MCARVGHDDTKGRYRKLLSRRSTLCSGPERPSAGRSIPLCIVARTGTCWVPAVVSGHDTHFRLGMPERRTARRAPDSWRRCGSTRSSTSRVKSTVCPRRNGTQYDRSGSRRWSHRSSNGCAVSAPGSRIMPTSPRPSTICLMRWEAFTCFLGDGRICLMNNAAERWLRGIALGGEARLCAGSDRCGERGGGDLLVDHHLLMPRAA